jgi:hypothetical protein
MRALQHVLGTAVAFGLRVRRPKISDQPHRASKNDTFNIIRLLPDDADDLHFKSTNFGIDLVYDETYFFLSVHVRYEKWVFLTNQHGVPRSCPLDSLEEMLLFGRTNNADASKNSSNAIAKMAEVEEEHNSTTEVESSDRECYGNKESDDVVEVKIGVAFSMLVDCENGESERLMCLQVKGDNGDGTYKCLDLDSERSTGLWNLNHDTVVNALRDATN